jgi:hypothetical protein
VESLKYTALDIAGWFIDFNMKFVATEEAELISPMKLQNFFTMHKELSSRLTARRFLMTI